MIPKEFLIRYEKELQSISRGCTLIHERSCQKNPQLLSDYKDMLKAASKFIATDIFTEDPEVSGNTKTIIDSGSGIAAGAYLPIIRALEHIQQNKIPASDKNFKEFNEPVNTFLPIVHQHIESGHKDDQKALDLMEYCEELITELREIPLTKDLDQMNAGKAAPDKRENIVADLQ
ncbi:hypothetical protein RLOatenuis_3500 [Rickettsiales bacterium]|nr:hypothetical protein RLOatenuis_3500 [Rickettsiales bacterium]